MAKVVRIRKDVQPSDRAPDPIFFSKERIKVGSILHHAGKLNPDTHWEVVLIYSFGYSHKRAGRGTSVDRVHNLHDLVTVQCKETGERRTLAFSYMSYSAIWRI